METTAKKAGLDADAQVRLVLVTIGDEPGSTATTAEILQAFDNEVEPHRLSAVGKAGIRCLVNREMVNRGLVTQAHGAAGEFAWAITEAGLARIGAAPPSWPRATAAVSAAFSSHRPRRVVRVIKKKDDVVVRLAVKAHASARKRANRHKDFLPRHVDPDDAAQEAALRAILRARLFDESRGSEDQFAEVVARTAVQDLHRQGSTEKYGRSLTVAGDVFDALAHGAAPVAVVATSPVVAFPRHEDAIDGRETAVRVVQAVRSSSHRAALTRWLAEGADGPQERFSGESRLKDALCAARSAARHLGMMEAAA